MSTCFSSEKLAVGHYKQFSPNMASQLATELQCVSIVEVSVNKIVL